MPGGKTELVTLQPQKEAMLLPLLSLTLPGVQPCMRPLAPHLVEPLPRPSSQPVTENPSELPTPGKGANTRSRCRHQVSQKFYIQCFLTESISQAVLGLKRPLFSNRRRRKCSATAQTLWSTGALSWVLPPGLRGVQAGQHCPGPLMATSPPCGTTTLASGSSSIPISRLIAAGKPHTHCRQGTNTQLGNLTSCHYLKLSPLHCFQTKNLFSGESPLPEAQTRLTPISAVAGGRLPWDAYNNGGEWINSVFHLGSSLVRWMNGGRKVNVFGSSDPFCNENIIIRWVSSTPRTISGVKKHSSTPGMEELISQFL